MYIAICDDRRQDAAQLQAHLPGHICHVFSSPTQLISRLHQKGSRYDLYFLDIYMGEYPEGIELAKQLRQLDGDADICFVSTSDEFYREAYDIQDINYLLKPVSAEALGKLLQRAEHRQRRSNQQSFRYKWNGQTLSVPYGNILYINSNNHALDIYCKDGNVLHCNAKLDDVEALLDPAVFFRCHQSFLVNLYMIDSLSGSDFVIHKKLIPISRRYFSEAKHRYQEILFEGVT